MNNLMRLNQAVEYIENNLNGEIDMAQVAQIALCSEFHFSKMFSYLAEMPLSEYVRMRKLTLAACDLQAPDISVLDVAIKYNYTSADAFTRAFKRVHGVLPSEVRNGSVKLKSFPKLRFEIKVTGGIEMEYRIVSKESFKIVGFKERVTITHNGVNPEIAAMYKRLDLDMVIGLKKLSNIEPRGIVALSTNFVDRHLDGVGTLDHTIGVATTESSSEFTETEIAAGTWVVFTSCGPFPQTLQATWAKIYGQWFPSSNYTPTGEAELVWHQSPDTTNPDYLSEIWIKVELVSDK